jgi:hypothetical protein
MGDVHGHGRPVALISPSQHCLALHPLPVLTYCPLCPELLAATAVDDHPRGTPEEKPSVMLGEAPPEPDVPLDARPGPPRVAAAPPKAHRRPPSPPSKRPADPAFSFRPPRAGIVVRRETTSSSRAPRACAAWPHGHAGPCGLARLGPSSLPFLFTPTPPGNLLGRPKTKTLDSPVFSRPFQLFEFLLNC